MRIDLVVYDAHGKTRGYACLKLDFGNDLWCVEEDAQRAWRSAGFSQSGPFEVIDNDVVWLWEQELGNAKHNTVVLTDLSVDETDAGQSGNGRIVTGQVGKFHGGSVFWTVSEPRECIAPAAPIELLAVREAAVLLATDLAA